MQRNIFRTPHMGPPPDTSGQYVAPPNGAPGVFTSHGGLPFWWRDETGMTHACEGAEIYAGSLAYWTLCQLDVPVREPFHPGSREKLTCKACLAIIRDRKGHDDQATRDINTPRPHSH
jgi:hypothetical protein